MHITDWVIAIAAGINAGAVVVLVCITWRYTRSTSGMLEEMKKQRRSADVSIAEARKLSVIGTYLSLIELHGGKKPDKGLAGNLAMDRVETLLTELEMDLGLDPLTRSN